MSVTAMPPLAERAACVRNPELFEPRRVAERLADLRARHARAIALCEECPALDACAAGAPTLPGFVVAGQVVTVGGAA